MRNGLHQPGCEAAIEARQCWDAGDFSGDCVTAPWPPVDGFEPLTEPEKKLRDKLRSGEPCSFLGEGEDVGDGDWDIEGAEVDKTRWGGDRTVRAAVLRAMLLDAAEAWELADGNVFDLRGAVVSGDLSGFEKRNLPRVRLAFCRFDGDVDFSNAIFTDNADLWETTFSGRASFDGATVKGEVRFSRATFAGEASFEKATLENHAAFGEAAFLGDALFEGARFKGNAGFNGVIFSGIAMFSEATFEGDAWFDHVISAKHIYFREATFSADAIFSEAGYTGLITFQGAKFLGTVDFKNSLADEIRFTGACFSTDEPGPCVASTVSLEGALLTVRTRFTITATKINAKGLQAREGAYLVVGCPAFDLSDSEFLRPSIVSSLPHGPEIPDPFSWPSPFDKSPRERERVKSEAKVAELRDRLTRELIDPQTASLGRDSEQSRGKRKEQHSAMEAVHSTPRCHVTSLTRANIGELVLSDVVLDACKFVGALGLDKLRVGPGCSFRQTPQWWRGKWRKDQRRQTQWRNRQWRKWRRMARLRIAAGRWWRWRRLARRRIIAEEIAWRRAQIANPARAKELDFLSAPDIAEIYRDLRKGLEEGKNEPGAADFYYGEMEMRRLAAREPTGGGTDRRRRPPSWAERALLNGYWATSGYGLRASRSLVTLAVLLIGAALLYTSPSFAIATPQPPTQITKGDPKSGLVTSTQPPPGAAPQFLSTLDYSARESISLLQSRGESTVTPKGPGKILDIILRLAGPVLLAFSVLAFRARIRR